MLDITENPIQDMPDFPAKLERIRELPCLRDFYVSPTVGINKPLGQALSLTKKEIEARSVRPSRPIPIVRVLFLEQDLRWLSPDTRRIVLLAPGQQMIEQVPPAAPEVAGLKRNMSKEEAEEGGVKMPKISDPESDFGPDSHLTSDLHCFSYYDPNSQKKL